MNDKPSQQRFWPRHMERPIKIISMKLKLNASTTTRLTTRCSGDLMGDQIDPGDQNGDQILIGVVPFRQISGAS